MLFTLVSTRFNTSTFQENENYRERKKIQGCIYCSPQAMSPKIDLDSLVFVIEMNNSLNRIEGIGLIRNAVCTDKFYRVYDTYNFNRYVFKGNYRISRSQMEGFDAEIVQILDYILFKERTHLKRGAGFTTVPQKLLNHPKCEKRDIKEHIRRMFIETFGSRMSEKEE